MLSQTDNPTPAAQRGALAADLRLLAANLSALADHLETTAVEDLPFPRSFAIGFAFGACEAISVGTRALIPWAAGQAKYREEASA